MEKIADSTLIAQFQNGDESALNVLIKRHQRDLFSFIYFKTSDRDLADDLFQETFIKIILRLKQGKYNDEGKFILWAKRIAHNLMIDYFRVKSRQKLITETTFENEDYTIFDTIKDPSKNIEEFMITDQINQDLYKLIEKLPKLQREVIKLRFFDGMSFNEISEYTNCSLNTTLGRVRYALINLRKILENSKITLTR